MTAAAANGPWIDFPEYNDSWRTEDDVVDAVSPGSAPRASVAAAAEPIGPQLRTYRLAISASAGYSAQFFGLATTDAQKIRNVHDEIARAVARINEVYAIELGIRFVLVPNNDSLIFLDAATDPFTDTDLSADKNANQALTDDVIGSAGYDLGHVFTRTGGGVASVGVLGDVGYKARGASGGPNATGDGFWVETVAHEIGHQFGGNHSFSGVGGSCSGSSKVGKNVEVGSGASIMSYAGLCSADDIQDDSDPYFTPISLDEIAAEIAANSATGTVSATGNTTPSLQIVPNVSDFAIPPQTPFVLTAQGADADGDALTYAWHQVDPGTSRALATEPKGNGALFRPLLPSASPERYFPSVASLLAGTTNQSTGSCSSQPTAAAKLTCRVEYLPTTARTMNFRVTVRDGRGGVRALPVTIAVTGARRFAVTAPNTVAAIRSGANQTITWDTGGSDAWVPAFDAADILYSTDGGTTWSMLAAGVPNDGSHDVVVPAVSTTRGRIKVQPVGAIFYDFSDADLTITQSTPDLPTPPTGITGVPGSTTAAVSWRASVESGAATITRYTITAAPGGAQCSTVSVAPATPATTCTISGLENGVSYTFSGTATSASGTSDQSSASDAVTPRATPAVPTIGTATVSGSRQLTVTFTPGASNGAAITRYEVWCYKSSGGATGGYAYPPATSAVVTSLTAGSAYTCSVSAENAAGLSDESSRTASVTAASAPAAPTIGAVTVTGSSRLSVAFTAGSANGSAITEYAARCTSSNGGAAGSATGVSSPIVVAGLTAGKTYTCTATATNALGPSAASAASASAVAADAPAAPSVGTVTVVAANQLGVAFTAGVDNGAAVTSFSATCTSGDGGVSGSATGSTSPITVGGLTTGKTYTCTVTATNAAGTSSASAPSASIVMADVAGLPGVPTIGTASTAGANRLSVTFSPGADNGSAITEFTARCVSGNGGAAGSASGTSSPIVVAALTAGRTYSCSVIATNGVGSSGSSAASADAVVVGAPDAPAIGDATATGANRLSVAFTAGPDNGSTITGFVATCTSSDGGAAGSASGASSPIAVTGLTAAAAYTCAVTATNELGTSSASARSASTVVMGVPGSPTSVTAVVSAAGQLSVGFVPGAANGSAITGYTASCASGDGGAAGSASGASSPLLVSSLTPTKPYTCSVTATNGAGVSTASIASATVVAAGVPTAPTIGAATVTGANRLSVAFTAGAANGATILLFTATCTSSDGGATGSVNGTSSPLVVTDLTASKTYTCTVTATNAAGTSAASGASSSAIAVTVPGAPSIGSVTPGDASATITWTAPSSNGGGAISSYTVTASPGGRSCVWSSGPLSCTVSGLANGTSYTFTVTATNVVGTGSASIASGSIFPRTLPGAPTGAAAVRGNSSAVVTWSAPASDGGGAITGYTVTAAPGGATCSTTSTAPATPATTCTVSGLANGTSYTFTVRATNAAGAGSASSASGAVTPAAVPDRPTITGVSVPAANHLSVAFVAGAANGSAISDFTATCASSNGGTTRSASGTASPLVVTGLTTGKSYTCTVTATSSIGTSPASEAFGDTVSAYLVSVTSLAGSGSVAATGGEIACPSTCTATYAPDAVVTLTASPASGWVFGSWGGACSGTSMTCSVIVSAARDVSLSFVQSPTSGGGSPPPSGGGSAGGSGFTSTPISVPSPTGVVWSVQNLAIVAEFSATAGVSYAIRATQGADARTGSCSVNGTVARCVVAVSPGTWIGEIIPANGSVRGATVSRSAMVTRVEPVRAVEWEAPKAGQRLAAAFDAAPGTTYLITATLKGKTVKGTCKVSDGEAVCSIPLRKPGKWAIVITPKKNGSHGSPAKKTISVR